jgi:hypothetical protein
MLSRYALFAVPLSLLIASQSSAQVAPPATAEESVLQGQAEVVRGKADYNLLTAEAVKLLKQARAQDIENERRALATYYEARELNKAATTDQIKRFTPEQSAALAKKQAPERLTVEEYNPVTGKLEWPALLQENAFSAHRQAIDYLFKKRTSKDVKAETPFHSTVRELTEDMLAMLQRHIDALPPMEYTAARKFVQGVEREAQLPPGPETAEPAATPAGAVKPSLDAKP